jgi:cobaltochelatase CobS
MDRWNIVTALNYLDNTKEKEIILSKVKNYNTPDREETIELMIKVADLSRKGLVNGDISTVMSPRTVLTWAENAEIFDFNIALSFKLTFLNKCDDSEKPIIAEYYQRCFGEDLMNTQSDITLT